MFNLHLICQVLKKATVNFLVNLEVEHIHNKILKYDALTALSEMHFLALVRQMCI